MEGHCILLLTGICPAGGESKLEEDGILCDWPSCARSSVSAGRSTVLHG